MKDVSKNNMVYKPSDDSFLMIEAMKVLKSKGYSYEKIIDLGSGSGVLSLVAKKLFNPKILVSVDISPYAVYSTYRLLKGESLVLRCDAATCVNASFDLAIINPPYIPSTDRLAGSDRWLVLSWQEGKNHEKLCTSSKIAENVLILKSTLSSLDQDRCMKRIGYEKREKVLEKRLFMEIIEANYWVKRS
ncbi:MAG: methyltransferase [Caldisphaeraceae archaeon]|nr:methyltransferase [Caldisphaeraceae archaeon]MEB3692277.1 methyltransferase [Caldisphaeraceae archaeon]MEB3798300.1 methyltransferase [Caldisphaeraceae archaeon]